ncbi:hydroxymethylbilane synthase, partial [Dialister invisus]
RQAQLLHLRPDLQIKTLRGNVQTRLRHLDEGNYDAVILAAAGLKRLGLQERIQSYISTCDSIPAAGQGVMAIETRIGDDETMEIIQFIHDEKVASCIMAERAFLEKVGGDCKVPAGIYAVPFLGHIEAVAFIGSPDGKEMYKRSLNGQTQDAKQLGESLAEALIADGGGRILEELRK